MLVPRRAALPSAASRPHGWHLTATQRGFPILASECYFGRHRCCAVIWDALKATCEAPDPETARLIIDSAGIIISKPDMTVCYDERGATLLYLCMGSVAWTIRQLFRFSDRRQGGSRPSFDLSVYAQI